LPPDSASKRIRLERLGLLARRLEQMDEIEAAEQMHRRRAQIDSTAQLDLAAFYGRQENVKEAFELLENLAVATRDLPPVILVAVHAIRESRDVVGDTYDASVRRWLDKALRENPDSDKLLFALSRFQEMQKKYAETEETYKRLIVHPDLGVRERAEVSNNLAFLLAVQGLKADEAMNYITEAIEVRGPTSALLDTRACVHIAQGNYDDAIKDLQLSLLQLKDPGVYYHLALALARSGDLSAARDAMGDARKNGLTANKLNPAERDDYKALNEQLKSGATAGAL
jgi:tetratricopeptide (TPR) repeat protein